MSKTKKVIPTRDPAIETKAQKKLRREFESFPDHIRYDLSKLEYYLTDVEFPGDVAKALFEVRDFIIDAMGAIHDSKIETRCEFSNMYYRLGTLEEVGRIFKKIQKTGYKLRKEASHE
jgi:hypothetical protein